MFEVNESYANRKGKYTVLAINPPKMTVKYEDGTTAELKIDVQARIWENIRVEHEPRRSTKTTRRIQKGPKVQHFIKVITLPSPTELIFAGWQERVVLLGVDLEAAPNLKSGDRLIYYALEVQQFIAVVTITSSPETADPNDYFYTLDTDSAYFLQVDIDAAAPNPDAGVAVDSVELESQPNFNKMELVPEQFIEVSEDDFELLAELLTEISEDEEEEEEEEDIEYDEEDEE